jgi:hypothetical protein
LVRRVWWQYAGHENGDPGDMSEAEADGVIRDFNVDYGTPPSERPAAVESAVPANLHALLWRVSVIAHHDGWLVGTQAESGKGHAAIIKQALSECPPVAAVEPAPVPVGPTSAAVRVWARSLAHTAVVLALRDVERDEADDSDYVNAILDETPGVPPPVADAGQDAERMTRREQEMRESIARGDQWDRSVAEVLGFVTRERARADAAEAKLSEVERERDEALAKLARPSDWLAAIIETAIIETADQDKARTDQLAADLARVERERDRADNDVRAYRAACTFDEAGRARLITPQVLRAERDQLATDLAVERGRVAALVAAKGDYDAADLAIAQSVTPSIGAYDYQRDAAVDRILAALADLDPTRLAHDERVRAEGREAGIRDQRTDVRVSYEHGRAEGHAAGVAEATERAARVCEAASAELHAEGKSDAAYVGNPYREETNFDREVNARGEAKLEHAKALLDFAARIRGAGKDGA